MVAIGPYWAGGTAAVEIDAVALAGRGRAAILAGEAKWGRRVNGDRIRWELERSASALPGRHSELRYAICARDKVDGGGDSLIVRAADIFP